MRLVEPRSSVVVGWLLCVGAAAAQPVQLTAVKVFVGKEGQRLELGFLEPRSGKQALVRFTGTGSEVDGLVVRGALDEQGAERHDAFVTRVHGSDGATFFRIKEGQGTAWVPGGQSFSVKFLELGSPELGKELAARHAEQLESGALALLAKKAFPHLVKKYDDKAAAALQELNQACGGKRSFTYDWAFIDDEVMENVNVADVCLPLLSAGKRACKALAGVTTLRCRVGPSFGLRREGDALLFTTTTKGKADGAAFVQSSLERGTP